MAQKVHIVLEDDLDGSPATETVSFGLDGKTYEIDLNDKNAGKLRDALAQYVGAARGPPAAAAAARPAARPTWARAPARSATGPGPTATRSPTAAGSRPTYARRSTPPTDTARSTGSRTLTRVPGPVSRSGLQVRPSGRPCSLSADRVGARAGNAYAVGGVVDPVPR